jgi:5'-3' exoribonuclease 2
MDLRSSLSVVSILILTDSKLSKKKFKQKMLKSSSLNHHLLSANVPGEGKQKIMDYIRRQRAQPSHDPNTSHILCGADADLIMLGLATHELNFTGMRQEFRPNKLIPCEICNQIGKLVCFFPVRHQVNNTIFYLMIHQGHEQNDCQGVEHPKCGENDEIGHNVAAKQNYIFIRLNVLRECLERELRMPSMSIVYDFERAIDDWIFMCLFIRNDYLPHLASLEIREGAIDRLVNLYKECVYKTKVIFNNAILLFYLVLSSLILIAGMVDRQWVRQLG